MSFDTIKNGIVGILAKQGYVEASSSTLPNIPTAEYGNSFLITPLSGEMGTDSETLSDRFHDVQKWQIQIAFEKSEQNEIINRDDLHRKKDILINELDDPTNWRTYNVRLQKYDSWDISDEKSYYVLTIVLKIIDTYIYT